MQRLVRVLVGLAGVVAVLLCFDPAAAAATKDEAGEVESEVAQQRARALFDQGQIHYALGEYDAAIARFREAYELSSAPALLFNIAQAHRLRGDCGAALEVYRHFVRLAPGSPRATEAEDRIRALTERCGAASDTPRAAPAPRAPDLVLAPMATPPSSPAATLAEGAGSHRGPQGGRWSNRARLSLALLAGAAALGAAAGAFYWWNDARYERWSSEDRRLTAGLDDPASGVGRQNQNDALLRSIWRVDKAVQSLAVASVVCVIGSAVLGITTEKGPQIAALPGEMRLAWRWSWR